PSPPPLLRHPPVAVHGSVCPCANSTAGREQQRSKGVRQLMSSCFRASIGTHLFYPALTYGRFDRLTPDGSPSAAFRGCLAPLHYAAEPLHLRKGNRLRKSRYFDTASLRGSVVRSAPVLPPSGLCLITAFLFRNEPPKPSIPNLLRMEL